MDLKFQFWRSKDPTFELPEEGYTYRRVLDGVVSIDETRSALDCLELIFAWGNRQPGDQVSPDYPIHEYSMSVGDVIMLDNQGYVHSYCVDRVGWKRIKLLPEGDHCRVGRTDVTYSGAVHL